MQKTQIANFITKQHIRNTGQLTQCYIEDNLPEIIEPWIWEAAVEETIGWALSGIFFTR